MGNIPESVPHHIDTGIRIISAISAARIIIAITELIILPAAGPFGSDILDSFVNFDQPPCDERNGDYDNDAGKHIFSCRESPAGESREG
jgi:hypothetical protein